MADSPALFVVLGILVYLIAYFVYGKQYNKKVWKPDAKKPTPAHVYMDGIEFFPANKYILYGFQFKSIAALGPILGPFIALTYGWLPALLWILLGNFFIGWLHDYGAVMLTVRNEGKTLGPLTYEYVSPRARNALIGFLLFYLILITATFVFLMATYQNAVPASVLGTLFVVIAGIISGVLIYRKVRIIYATIIGLIIVAVGIIVGYYVPISLSAYLGDYTLLFWMIVICIYCFIAAVTPLTWYTQPVVYMASYPAIFGIILLITGALLSPFTGVVINQPMANVGAWFGIPSGKTIVTWVGPLWPILTVSIACGAISGWHSLVGTSGSGRQLDVETDALPVGAGSMLTEGLLALASLAAYMVLVVYSPVNWVSLVAGAQVLVSPLLGGAAAGPFIAAFFGTWLVIFALTVEMLIIRFFRLAMAEATASRPTWRTLVGNKYVATFIGLAIGVIFASTGAWSNIWLLFGGSNQLLAGLTLLLITLYLSKEKKRTGWTLWPAIFMVLTCLAALFWEALVFFAAIALGTPLGLAYIKNLTAALVLNGIFGVIAIILFLLGLVVARDWYRAYKGKAPKVAKEKEKKK
nr:carbon starvation CstA family protein [Candidatus Njordarchaeota archaeon]